MWSKLQQVGKVQYYPLRDNANTVSYMFDNVVHQCKPTFMPCGYIQSQGRYNTLLHNNALKAILAHSACRCVHCILFACKDATWSLLPFTLVDVWYANFKI